MQGSAYKVNWYSDAGEEYGTTSFADDRYTSSLTLKFEKAGNNKIGYTIVMTAGKSGTSFVASAFVMIKVTPKIDHYEIREWKTVNLGGTADYPEARGLLYEVYDNKNEEYVDKEFTFYLDKEFHLYKPIKKDGMVSVAGLFS